jgi:integrase
MAKITNRNGFYYLCWSGPEISAKGRKIRHSQSLGKVGVVPAQDLKDALNIKEYELSTAARLLNVHRRPAPTFRNFVADYLLWHKAEFPDSHYRVEQIVLDHLLTQEWADTPLNLILVEQIERYKQQRKFKARGATVEKELRVFQAVMNRAVKLDVLDKNPVAVVKPPKKTDSKPHHWYSKDELEKLYQQSHYGPIWRFMANTGLRRGEALHLRRQWITDAVRIQSTGEERTKSGSWRKVPLTDGAREALKEIPENGLYLLPRIAPESLTRAFARDCRRANVAGSLHSLRHTYICHLLLAGVPIRTVQLYAGHSSITTTEKYAYQVLQNDPEAVVRLAI